MSPRSRRRGAADGLRQPRLDLAQNFREKRLVVHRPRQHTAPTAYSGTKGYDMNFTRGLQEELAGTGVRVQLVLPATTATEIWERGGLSVTAFDPATVMTAEDCVDAALVGLDAGEAIALPSVEDASLFAAYDAARLALFAGGRSGTPASRYHLN